MHPNNHLQSSELSSGKYIVIDITDQNIGMNNEIKARAFDPFSTTKESRVGTELGLSMVHGSINQSGGMVDITSNDSVGVTIYPYLPGCNHAQNKLKKSRVKIININYYKSTEAILLVKDDAALRRYIVYALTQLGYRIDDASDSEKAESLLTKCSPLTDLVMSGNNSGLKLINHVKQKYPSINVLCISGYSTDLNKNKQVSRHIPFMRKPFDQQYFVHTVRFNSR